MAFFCATLNSSAARHIAQKQWPYLNLSSSSAWHANGPSCSGQKAGSAASKEATTTAIEEVKAEFASKEALIQALEEAGIPSLEACRGLVYEVLTYSAYLEHLLQQLQTSEPALRVLYLLSKQQFAIPEQYCSPHILVATVQEANQVIARLGRGENFADLAKELSPCRRCWTAS